MTPQHFVEILTSLSFDDTFNPYTDRCPTHDRANAPSQRRNNLLAMLKAAAESEVDAIWIGRDLGYRGGRRTGLALTDEVHLQHHGDRWGISISKSTKGEALGERTAAVIWDVLSQIDTHIFLWNVFPLHPHEAGNPFTNRSHNSCERKAGEEILSALIDLLSPRRLVAIGNDAARSACRLFGDSGVAQIRHPSYGGQTKFLSSIYELYSIHPQDIQMQLI